MVVRRIARWFLSVITMLFAGSAAVAQTDSLAPGAGGRGKFRTACGQDVQRFCVGVQPGGGPPRAMSIVPILVKCPQRAGI